MSSLIANPGKVLEVDVNNVIFNPKGISLCQKCVPVPEVRLGNDFVLHYLQFHLKKDFCSFETAKKSNIH